MIRGVQVNIARFRQCSFKHIDRNANRAAHSLAGLAHSSLDYIWLEETHPLLFLLSLCTYFNAIIFFIQKKIPTERNYSK
jgi:hypothetical protein